MHFDIVYATTGSVGPYNNIGAVFAEAMNRMLGFEPDVSRDGEYISIRRREDGAEYTIHRHEIVKGAGYVRTFLACRRFFEQEEPTEMADRVKGILIESMPELAREFNKLPANAMNEIGSRQTSKHDLILCGFDWNRAPQGYDFWDTVWTGYRMDDWSGVG